jgi:hypothetical protein
MPQTRYSVIKVRAVSAMPRSYSMVRSVSGQCETKRNNRPGSHRIAGARCFSLTPRPWWAGVVLAGCLGSASGRALRLCPHRLTPSSPQGGRSDKPLSHKRCLSLWEPGAVGARKAETRGARTHMRTHAHTCTRTHAHAHMHTHAFAHTHPRPGARTRTHTRTRTRARAR